MKHELKTWTEYFNLVESGDKSFELRKNDRNYKVGDILILKDYDHINEKYTGREIEAEVTCMVENVEHFGLIKGFVIMNIKILMPENEVSSVDENEQRENYCVRPGGKCYELVGVDYTDCVPCKYYREQ